MGQTAHAKWQNNDESNIMTIIRFPSNENSGSATDHS